jgi:signal transduction histidine kinase
MTLADFIVENIAEIIEEWVGFARTLTSARGLDVDALRDHAEKMLLTVAAEMRTEESDERQRLRSRGEARTNASAETAADAHGDQRYGHGFSLEELVSEYRALRATVIRLWVRRTTINDRTVYELTRFNEGIDQLLAESVVHFAKQLDRARHLFMGVLGHDLRTDLHVILASIERLERTPSKDQIEKYVPFMKEGANNILAMIEDLLDVARTRLGSQLPLETSRVDAAALCPEVLQAFRQLNPSCEIRLKIDGDVSGEWDRKRLHQMLANLVRNAIQHGDPSRPVTLSAQGGDENVIFKVHNYGTPIPASLITHIFDPLQQGKERQDPTSLGLGLYIASTVAQGHLGTLTAKSSATAGTTFTATLPRQHRAKTSLNDEAACEFRTS